MRLRNFGGFFFLFLWVFEWWLKRWSQQFLSLYMGRSLIESWTVTTFYSGNELLRFMLLGELRITIWLRIPRFKDADLKAWGCTSFRTDLEQYGATCLRYVSTLLGYKKDMNLFDRLYLGSNNLSQGYDVIQELFRSKQKSETLVQFYNDFNKLSAKVKEIFFYHSWSERDAGAVKQANDSRFLRNTASRVFEARLMWLAAPLLSHLGIHITSYVKFLWNREIQSGWRLGII